MLMRRVARCESGGCRCGWIKEIVAYCSTVATCSPRGELADPEPL